MEHKMALWIAKSLNHSCERTELETVKMVYGLEVILDNILKFLCIIVFSVLLGIFKEAIFVLLGFGLLRLRTGGFHFDKNVLCWLTSILLTIGGGLLAHMQVLNREVTMVLFIISGILVAFYAPVETKSFFVEEEERQKIKVQGFLLVVLYSGLTYIFWSKWIGSALIIGVVCQTISILPIINRKYKEDYS